MSRKKIDFKGCDFTEKFVEKGCSTTCITLDSSCCKVTFDCRERIIFPNYVAFACQNDSPDDVILSLDADKTSTDDGVMVIKSGASAVMVHRRNVNTCYITGSGVVQVAALSNAINPFNPVMRGGGGGDVVGTADYSNLQNKPKINDVTLTGNKTLEDLGMREIPQQEVTQLWNDVFNIGG